MKLVTEKAAIVEALGIVSRAVSTRSSLQVLSGVLLEITGDGGRLSATNMEISIRTPLRGTVEEEGSIVLPARIFGEIARSLAPQEVVIEQKGEDGQVEIRSGESVFQLQSLPAGDFPQFPVFSQEGRFTVPRPALLETIDRVAPSASRDETRPVLMGVLTNFMQDTIKMVATDSYRLSVQETPAASSVAEKVDVIVPSRSLAELSRIGGSAPDEDISIAVGENQILFQVEDTSVISRLIDGQFPNYRQLLPETFEYEAEVDREELLEVVHRIGLMAQKNAPVRLEFEANTLTVKAQAHDVGRAHESLPVRYEGEMLHIGFNPEFLEAGLAAVRGTSVRLRFISPLRPGLIVGEDDGFLYLIMPIRLTE